MSQINQMCNFVIVSFLVLLVVQVVFKIDIISKLMNLFNNKEPLLNLPKISTLTNQIDLQDNDLVSDEDLVDSENSEQWDEVVKQHIPIQNLGSIPQQSQVIGPISRPTHQVSFNDSVRTMDVPNANLPQPTAQFNNMGAATPPSSPDKYNLGGPVGPPPAPTAGSVMGEIQPFDPAESSLEHLDPNAPTSYMDQQWSLLGQ